MPQLHVDGEVWLLDLGDTENRFRPDWITEVGEVLDKAVAADGPRALVTCATGKFWSNGLDLDWMGAHPGESPTFLRDVHRLLAQVLASPVPTVAAVQGHAFAAGAMLSRAHDVVVMRADRGFWCLPEVDIGLPFTPGMSALLTARLAPAAAHEAMTTGRRYGGADAAARGIVEEAVDEDAVLPRAVERARELAPKAGPTYAAIKEQMYAPALRALRDHRGDT